jgi:outer membrane protein OmpA-like peptidoglycan-associated protein
VNGSTVASPSWLQIADTDVTNRDVPRSRSFAMFRTRPSHLSRIALLASGAMLFLGGAASAQTVSIFDDAPTIEQLRSIMVPESRPGAARSIVIQRPDPIAPSESAQRASTQVLPTPRAPVAKARPSAPPVVKAAASMPAPKKDTADEARAVAFHVNFAFDSAALPDSAYEMIGMIAQLMKESPQIKVRVEGHTDAIGSMGYNLSLSERRALSVAEYIARQGIESERLELVGKGMAEPVTSNKYDAANRRVQFVRID